MKPEEIYDTDNMHKIISSLEWVMRHDEGFRGTALTIKANAIFLKSKRLEFLSKLPEYIGRDFFIENNKLTSIKGFPKEIVGTLECYNEEMQSLDAGHLMHVRGDLDLTGVEWDDGHAYEEKRRVYMQSIYTVGEIIVDGEIIGFRTDFFLKNSPDESSLLNAIDMLSSCRNSDTYKADISAIQDYALSVKDEPSSIPLPSQSKRF